MRIAMFHELHEGGARRAVVEIGRRLAKNNKVDLYVSSDKVINEEREAFGRAFSIPFKQKEWRKGDWRTKLYKDTYEYLKLLLHNRRIARRINKGNYDVVFIHPSQFTQAPFVMQFLNKLIIYYCQEPLRIIYDKALNDLSHVHGGKKIYELTIRFIRKIIDSSNLKKADRIFANSKFSKENIKKAYGINAKVMYLGVDHNFFKPAKVKKDIDVLYIGSHERIEMYHLLKSAMERLPKKLKYFDHFPGKTWLSDVDLRNLYRRSKIVLCFHKNEPFGLIPIEAGACGSVVIAFDRGGHKESVINGVTGYLIPEDPTILAKKIKSLISNPVKLNTMGKTARTNVVKNWTWDKNVRLIATEIRKTYEKNN